MIRKIDILIINNCPSFYKINLYNELSKYCKIHVVFIGLTNQVVINRTYKADINFSFDILNAVQIEKRNKVVSMVNLFRIIQRYKFKKIIYGGYNDLEERIFLFLTPKKKNCLQFESSIHESKTIGLISYVKRILFSRVSIALPPGKMQTAVFESLKFKGQVIETKGVGIFFKSDIGVIQSANKKELRYLYIGRLIPLKNLEFLVKVFNELQRPLTIVGTGDLEEHLKSISNSNITFTGFVENNSIYKYYCSHDVFVLPSLSETWGLVIEEAIFYGLPVLVSDAVGCQYEMVFQPQTGCVFNSNNNESLISAIKEVDNNIGYYRNKCKSFDFKQRDKMQVEAYLKILR